jgi:hypothetical protein
MRKAVFALPAQMMLAAGFCTYLSKTPEVGCRWWGGGVLARANTSLRVLRQAAGRGATAPPLLSPLDGSKPVRTVVPVGQPLHPAQLLYPRPLARASAAVWSASFVECLCVALYTSTLLPSLSFDPACPLLHPPPFPPPRTYAPAQPRSGWTSVGWTPAPSTSSSCWARRATCLRGRPTACPPTPCPCRCSRRAQQCAPTLVRIGG